MFGSKTNLKQSDYAEEKYRTNQAAAGEAGLLCDVSAGWAGAEALAPAPQQGDACVSGDDGGSDGAGHSGAGFGPRLEPPFAPSVRQPMGGVDDAARAEAGHLERVVHPVPHPLRAGATTSNQIS